MTVPDGLAELSRSICGGTPVAVQYRIEPWCEPNACFANVARMARKAGGAARFGWCFVHMSVPGEPGLLIATHHAVWADPGGRLVDITPPAPPPAAPLGPPGRVLFLPDDDAPPIQPPGFAYGYARPSRVLPLGDSARLARIAREYLRFEAENWVELAGLGARSEDVTIGAPGRPLRSWLGPS